MSKELDLSNRVLCISTRASYDADKIIYYLKNGKDLADLGLYLELNVFNEYQVIVSDRCNIFNVYMFNSKGELTKKRPKLKGGKQ